MTEHLPVITFVFDAAIKTGVIGQCFFGGKNFAILITHPEKQYAYLAPYSEDLILEGKRGPAWASAINESKGQFVRFFIKRSNVCN